MKPQMTYNEWKTLHSDLEGIDCDTCKTTGEIECENCYGSGDCECDSCETEHECGKCEGYGTIECPDCDGEGKSIKPIYLKEYKRDQIALSRAIKDGLITE